MTKSCFLIIVLSTSFSAVALKPFSEFAGNPARGLEEQKRAAEDLEVRISPLKDVIAAGDTLSVRVEISNIGTQDLFICKQFHGVRLVFCNLDFSFDPSVKAPRRAWAADTFPGEKESFANALVRNWVLIPPKHFYGAIIELNPGSYPELKTVGRYRVAGRYVSSGLLAPLYYNNLLGRSEEVAQLPGKSWQGEVDTNSIVVHVIAKKN